MNTTLPEVHVQYHGINDYGTHDVATKGTINAWVASLPSGTVITVQEATDHIIQYTGADRLLYEGNNQSDLQAVGYCLDENSSLELLSPVDFFYASDPQTQYRKK